MKTISLQQVLFLDIETVPQYPHYDALPERMKALWDHKALRLGGHDEDTPATLYPRAGIYAEFGRIVCISTGYFHQDEFRIKSFSGDDEKVLLKEFSAMLSRFSQNDDAKLCAHNGREFDFPYIARRMLINRLKLPTLLDVAGKKPWELKHFIDTLELWKFGDYKHYTSLALLTAIFDIPTPKEDIDGSMVWHVYWEDSDLRRITTYCERDVVALARLLGCMKGLEMVPDEKITIIT